jgi:hypothetical protein
MFIEAIVPGLIVGWLRGGKLRQLGTLSLIAWPLPVAAMLLQSALWIDFGMDRGFLYPCARFLHPISYLPLLLFMVLNRKIPGMPMIGLGLLLNLLVITANGGAMPVDPAGLAPPLQEELLSGNGSPIHIPLTENTRLALLGDRNKMPYGESNIISIGDIVLAAGLLWIIQQGMQVPGGHGRRR